MQFSSQFPFAIYLGDRPFLLHGIFEFLAIFIAFRYYLFLRKRQQDTIAPLTRWYLVIAAAFGAVLGSRFLGSLENVHAWRASANGWTYFYNNKTLVGGLLGGLAAVELVKLLVNERRKSGDLFVYPLLLGMIIGRIGCFSAGVYEETYGIPTRLPWGMDLGDGLARHPVALYEIGFLAFLWAALHRLARSRPLQEGALFKIFMIAYLMFRFLLDFIKPGQRYAAGLGSIQLACLAGLAYYYRYLLRPSLLLQTRLPYAR